MQLKLWSAAAGRWTSRERRQLNQSRANLHSNRKIDAVDDGLDSVDVFFFVWFE